MDGLPEALPGDRRNAADAGSTRTDAHRTRLRSTVLDISTTLMTAEPDEFETKLRWTLGNVGEQVGADRGCIFQLEEDAFRLTTEWTGDGIDPREIRRLDPDEHEWLFGQLEGFENVAVADSADIPGGTAREFLRTDGVRSAAILPMIDSWSLVGFVGFEIAETTHQWSASDVDVLRTAADIMTHSQARVRREQTLAEQNERLEAFASVISHDLRNPLNVVSGSLDLARTETDSEHLDRAARAADRMDDLIDQVLTLAREGEDISETQAVRLDSVAERAWTAVDSGAANLCLVDELGRIEADPDRLQEAFENLFRNAVEHAGEDVTVRIGRLETGFYVEDDGPGIPPDRRESVFERGNSSNDGTGLGLSIVQSIVEAHGWSIHVAADADADAGARFDVTGAAMTTE